jgi:hypothetical protein
VVAVTFDTAKLIEKDLDKEPRNAEEQRETILFIYFSTVSAVIFFAYKGHGN